MRTKEDFTSLGLDGSDLVAVEAIPGGHDETKDYVRDLVRVQWRANDPIELYIIRPAGVKKPPVVLYLFSYPSDTERFLDVGYCKRMVSNGAAAVGFVSALTGQRISHRPLKQWFISELQESLATTVHDVPMILNYLQSRDDLDTSRIGFFGQGSGGAIAILAAAADPRIQALDLLGPWGDWPDFLAEAKGIPADEQPNYLKPEFLKKLEPLEPLRILTELKTRKIRLQFVDQQPPAKWMARIEKAMPPTAEIKQIATADELHELSSSGKLFQWIADQLKPATTASVSAQAQISATEK
jgi:hypothetical protein